MFPCLLPLWALSMGAGRGGNGDNEYIYSFNPELFKLMHGEVERDSPNPSICNEVIIILQIYLLRRVTSRAEEGERK